VDAVDAALKAEGATGGTGKPPREAIYAPGEQWIAWRTPTGEHPWLVYADENRRIVTPIRPVKSRLYCVHCGTLIDESDGSRPLRDEGHGCPTGEKVYWVNARCPESKEIDAILGTGEKGEPGPEGKPSPPVCEVCKRAATEIFWPDGDRCHHFCKSHYEVAARIARLKALIQSESDVILTDNGYFSVTGSNDVGVNTATGGLVRWESITAVFKRAKETK